MRRPTIAAACCAALLALAGAGAQAAVSAVDDSGHTVTLQAPAQRIVSLSPQATELLFAVGAGARIVGAIEFSNYPAEANKIPTVGSATMLDIERIIASKPDLIVIWGSGNLAPQVGRLRAVGIPIYDSEPRDFDMIATSLERLAVLAGTDAAGKSEAAKFRARLTRLAADYRERDPVTVFYQVWREPLMTLNDTHMVSSAIRLCGGRNIFGALPQIAPTVSIEAVLKANPEVIVGGTSAQDDSMAQWQRFPKLRATARGNLVTINSDLLTRAGPRILDGTAALCRSFDDARKKRNTAGNR
jgi:iron complex transport system substrate-binding protein